MNLRLLRRTILGFSVLIHHIFRYCVLTRKYLKLGPNIEEFENDLILIVNQVNKGWILDKICRVIIQKTPKIAKIHYTKDCKNLPPSKIYFFSHYLLFIKSVYYMPRILYSNSIVFYTHTNEFSDIKQIAPTLNDASKIICMCSYFEEELAKYGTQRRKLTFILGGGADPKKFTHHDRGHGCVGLCSAFYPRKNPDTIFSLIEYMSSEEFMLLGKGWESYENFQTLMALPNFRYVETDYEEYHRYYAVMDVFVSLSNLEGGPIPLLEAMMSNVFPVVSDTGFAPDIINHGENGFLFDIGTRIEQIAALIRDALHSQVNVRETVKDLTWARFSEQINESIDAM